MHKALAQLEEATGWEGVAHDESAPPELRIQLSIAISMKRIADMMENGIGAIGGVGGLSHIAWQIGRDVGSGFSQTGRG